jgi:formiminoglutamate deiminase
MTSYWCERLWQPDGVREGVVVTDDEPAPEPYRLSGLVFPGFANAHSHAFHRALRGRTHGAGGTFWTWREAMYTLAQRLDPDSYLALARAVYGEMALAGITRVGEFHYLHHAPGGARYDDPNAMAQALRQAAADAGIRLTLLDTCYLAGGIDAPLSPVQQRFSDGTAQAWAERVAALRADETMTVGAAIHSVRAVPRVELATVARADEMRPLHVHLSEQPAENEQCRAAYGRTPTELLAESGVLSARTTVVHATHLSTTDIGRLGSARVGACLCPTTEADLADGIGPARELADAGCSISLGSDQHAVLDPFVEARALEHGERLRTGRRGRFTPAELGTALTTAAHASLGQPERSLDLVAVRMDSVRTAGCAPEQVLLAATAADVHTVVVGGEIVVRDGHHEKLGDVGRLLREAIERL